LNLLPLIFFDPIPLIPGIVSAGLIFPFTDMCTQYLHCVHLPIPFPHSLLPPTGTNASDTTYSALLFSSFVKEKK
jgi:hypothetical protein